MYNYPSGWVEWRSICSSQRTCALQPLLTTISNGLSFVTTFLSSFHDVTSILCQSKILSVKCSNSNVHTHCIWRTKASCIRYEGGSSDCECHHFYKARHIFGACVFALVSQLSWPGFSGIRHSEQRLYTIRDKNLTSCFHCMQESDSASLPECWWLSISLFATVVVTQSFVSRK